MVPAARAFVRAMLDGSPRIDDAALVVSEFATNALRHTPSGAADGTFTVAVTVRCSWARIAVSDAGAGDWQPSGINPDADSEYGRGLLLAEEMADKIGHDRTQNGQTMWADFGWSGQS